MDVLRLSREEFTASANKFASIHELQNCRPDPVLVLTCAVFDFADVSSEAVAQKRVVTIRRKCG